MPRPDNLVGFVGFLQVSDTSAHDAILSIAGPHGRKYVLASFAVAALAARRDNFSFER